MCGILRIHTCSLHSGEAGLGDLWNSIVRGYNAIPGTPSPFHSLWMETQSDTPPYQYPVLVYGLPVWGMLTWISPSPLVHYAYRGAGYPCVPPTGAGCYPLSWTLYRPIYLQPGVLWQHRRTSSYTRWTELDWGFTSPPAWLAGRWLPTLRLRPWPLGKRTGGTIFQGLLK